MLATATYRKRQAAGETDAQLIETIDSSASEFTQKHAYEQRWTRPCVADVKQTVMTATQHAAWTSTLYSNNVDDVLRHPL